MATTTRTKIFISANEFNFAACFDCSSSRRSSIQRSSTRNYSSTRIPNSLCTFVPGSQKEKKVVVDGLTDIPSLRLTLANREAEIENQVKA